MKDHRDLPELFAGRHPGAAHFEPLFAFEHLEGARRTLSRSFADQVAIVLDACPVDGPELSAGLRKLLEAKDCAVRHVLLTGTA